MAEALLKIGPDECAVDRLDNDGLSVEWLNDLLDTTPAWATLNEEVGTGDRWRT
jgi:hypothetical protein